MSYGTDKMIAVLSNKILRKESIDSDRDYSGGGYFSEIRHSRYLYADMTFRYDIETHSGLSSGGLYLPNQSSKEYFGVWDVIVDNYKYLLVFTYDNYSTEKFETENLGTGLQRLNNETWNRFLMQ